MISSAARAEIDYDFSTGAGVNHFGFKSTIPSSVIPPAVNTIPNTSFTSADNSNVSATDDLRQLSNASGSAYYAASRFVFSINESPASITAVTVSWEGLTSSRGSVSVYLWNAQTTSYTLVGSTATRSSPDAYIANTFTVNPRHYIDSSSRITVLALNAQNSKDVLTDSIRVSLRQCESNAECDDDNECTNDDCSAGACTHSNNTASCSDGDACTIGDACSDGICQSGAAPDCSNTGDSCHTASCDPAGAEGNCDRITSVTDGSPCDDNAFCTADDTCLSGLCVGGGTPCEVGTVCDEIDDSCVECLDAEQCDDGVACTDDSCDAGNCVYSLNDEHCLDDGQYCNGAEFCDVELGCRSTGDPCLEGEFCNEETDACDQCRTDADCDDDDPCTVGHSCAAGTCQAANAVDCSGEGDQCNAASCDPQGETGNCDILTPAQNGTECDDGAFCTVDDACTAGVCAGSARDCGHEDDQCNIGACNEESDACLPQPIADGAACDDGLFCTVADVCTGGVCGGSSRDCSFAGDQCNAGVCNEDLASCQPQPLEDGTSCEDGDPCTTNDACGGGVCESSRTFGRGVGNSLIACLGGPVDGVAEECGCYDINDDGHVDMLDVDLFMRLFDGQ